MLGILHPTSTHFNRSTSSTMGSYMDASWAEDDAWDSASDSESPKRPSTLTTTLSSGPISVVRAASSSSTAHSTGGSGHSTPYTHRLLTILRLLSNLAFSYTHLNAPDPSSYPPKRELLMASEKPDTEDTSDGIPMTNATSTAASVTSQKGDWTIVQTEDPQREGRYPEEDSDIMIVGDMEGLDLSGSLLSIDESIIAENRFKSKERNEAIQKIRKDALEIVADPLQGIRNYRRRRPSPSPTPSIPTSSSNSGIPIQVQSTHSREKSEKLMRERSIRSNRKAKFIECLSSRDVNINELRKLAWAGIPTELRPMAWQLLLGYMPLASPSRSSTLARKRAEYHSMVETTFARGKEGLDQQIWHQIEIDVPRTRPGVRLWMLDATQRCLERILYVWAIRHPASGYVQGINDLVTPFFQVFMSAYIDEDPENFDPALLPKSVVDAIEADSFWCLSRLLDGIQDNYISAQPGIHRSVKRMQELVARIDPSLSSHLEAQNVEFMQFAFRWMNCLLMREISVQNTIRMWDTYLDIIIFLQSLPTQGWGDHEIEMLLSEAFVLNATWQNAQSHFNGR
ncbi:tbc1 domain family protein [Ephemerocybe angulata]|uniref:Tbc1 domain family protein n=1 Tax=Ephemerocybe angulata TaxID=980116 RepID=A0A8H6MCQ3_9AGAR|nr:tbc1 domain family protein [Tulosesus angulatus]